MRTLLLVIALAATTLPAPSRAQTTTTDSLTTLIRGFYTPYLATDSNPPDALTTLAAHATPALRALIAQDEACEKRVQGVCNIDFDPIINGQDWDLQGKLPTLTTRQPNPAEIDIAAKFTTAGTKTEVDYTFKKSGPPRQKFRYIPAMPNDRHNRAPEGNVLIST